MAPLGSRRNSNPKPNFSPYETHNIQTLNTNGKFFTIYVFSWFSCGFHENSNQLTIEYLTTKIVYIFHLTFL